MVNVCITDNPLLFDDFSHGKIELYVVGVLTGSKRLFFSVMS